MERMRQQAGVAQPERQPELQTSLLLLERGQGLRIEMSELERVPRRAHP